MLEMLDRATAALLLLSSLKADCWLLTWTYHPGSNPNPDPDLVPDPHRLLESDDLLLPLVNCLLLLDSALVKELLIPGQNSRCYWFWGWVKISEAEWKLLTLTWSAFPLSASVSLLNFQWLPGNHNFLYLSFIDTTIIVMNGEYANIKGLWKGVICLCRDFNQLLRRGLKRNGEVWI